MPAQTAIPKTAIYAVVVVAIVGLFIYAMNIRAGGAGGALKIKAGNSEISMDFSDNKVNFTDLLNTLLHDPKYKKDVYAILADSYGLYPEDSDKLIDEIRREPGDSAFSAKMRDLLAEKKGPFDQKFHHYYDITNPDTVDAINKLDYYSKVAARLREMKDNSEGIFQPRAVTVSISFSSDKKILDGNAAVCKGSSYRGKDLLLLNPRDRKKAITVFARNNFTCIFTDQSNQQNEILIKINHNDAKKLFGDIVLSTKEKAILFPTQEGVTFEPMVVGLN